MLSVAIPLISVKLPAVSGILVMPAVAILWRLVMLPAMSGNFTTSAIHPAPSGDLSLATLAVVIPLMFAMPPAVSGTTTIAIQKHYFIDPVGHLPHLPAPSGDPRLVMLGRAIPLTYVVPPAGS
jgi:hypothetical protein